MINKELSTNLKKAFLKIGFHENKGGDLSVNEYDVKLNNGNPDASYLNQTITVEALFERSTLEAKFYNTNTFLNTLKQYFVVSETSTAEVDNKRHKLILTLMQASTTC